MEMATALHSSPTPFISLTNPNPKRGFSFSSSLLVNQLFGRTLSSTLTTKPPFNFHSRNSIRTSLKCSVSGATEAVPGCEQSLFLTDHWPQYLKISIGCSVSEFDDFGTWECWIWGESTLVLS
ncbi:hypothetical protein CsSME_00045662 [Camellia sinensis var. sinensis]